jgi:ABC-2 type transport system permease protein
MILAFAVGALGNLLGAAIRGSTLVWDVTPTQCLYYVLGMVLSLLLGFMLGVLFRASTGAIVAYFILTFLVPSVFGLLAQSQQWFATLQPWIDIQFAQTGFFSFDHALTTQEWAHIAVTGVTWQLIPLLIGLRLVMRSEVK